MTDLHKLNRELQGVAANLEKLLASTPIEKITTTPKIPEPLVVDDNFTILNAYALIDMMAIIANALNVVPYNVKRSLDNDCIDITVSYKGKKYCISITEGTEEKSDQDRLETALRNMELDDMFAEEQNNKLVKRIEALEQGCNCRKDN